MNESGIKLSVVVAAYNEEAVISRNMQRIVEELSTRPKVTWELLCINDGSKDKTGVHMDEFAQKDARVRIFHHRRNFGQGRALRTAFDMCKGEIVVTLDADLSYGPEYIYRLVDAISSENVDIALASAYAKGGSVSNVPFYRYILSRWGNRYLAGMSRYSISTSTCVVRSYRREVIDTICLTSDGMELQLEILMKAAMMRFKVCEIPANLKWADNKAAEASLSRTSKMRIISTIRMYLLMGWLSRPAYAFIIASFMLIGVGLYMAACVFYRILAAISRHINEGFIQALTSSLNEVFETYTYTIAFSSAFLLIGIQILAFALVALQNKFYFEELYRIGQKSTRDKSITPDNLRFKNH